jgi:hypothetical protein
MIRYQLDSLGWYQFEWLMQALFKEELGIGVESWGGRFDYGRDIFCAFDLKYPSRHLISEGPFLFQVKFIENANSAGAIFKDLLEDSVRKEISAIQKRASVSPKSPWSSLKHYTLITNAIPAASLRTKIGKLFNEALPNAKVHILGGNDICDLLDGQVSIRRSFPQLLSLRDLDSLIASAINRESRNRSQAAIACAQEVVSVFVPTSAYYKAFEVLRKHNFVVLEGPPEMGKTAIAWMIALTELCQGWEALVCDYPDDFFSQYDSSVPQVFIADDAFGRTEYDVSRGQKWEKQLDRVLRFLDPTHRLIWTSRKHILERAKRAMDLQGKATAFPNPASIIVNASHLTTREKALILYRHARANSLNEGEKAIVCTHAVPLVNENSFTPERIRRFVVERLPVLADEASSGSLEAKDVEQQVLEVIQNPTERMRKSFEALSPAHKWFLIAFLESGSWTSESSIQKLYLCHRPREVAAISFNELVEELTESFITKVSWSDTSIYKWTHPSYRDLVIDELAGNHQMNARFLENMSIRGIKLAISDTGGESGKRRFPLMSSLDSWHLLEARLLTLASQISPVQAEDLFSTLGSAIQETRQPTEKELLLKSLEVFAEVTRKRWNERQETLTADTLKAYVDACMEIRPLPAIPSLYAAWDEHIRALESAISNSDDPFELGPAMTKLAELIDFIHKNEPRFFRQIDSPDVIKGQVSRIPGRIMSDLRWIMDLKSAEDFRMEAERFREVARDLRKLAMHAGLRSHEIRQVLIKLDKESKLLLKKAENRISDDEGENPAESDPDDMFDVNGLFVDL